MLIEPHGGVLRELYLPEAEALEARRASGALPSVVLDHRHLCDLELLLDGAFSPLDGFMGEADYEAVVNGLRLVDGTLWPMPIALDVTEDVAASLSIGQEIVLRDVQGTALALLTLSDMYRPDKAREAMQVYGTLDTEHPGVADLLRRDGVCLGGSVRGIQRLSHHDFIDLRATPQEMRTYLADQGWERIIAFQTRNPLHRAHVELTRRAIAAVDGKLLLHPVVGRTKDGDVDTYTRVSCYRALVKHYPAEAVKLAVLPLAMRMAGPREALWHAIIRKNFGANHFIVGRDHAGPGKDASGRPFYDPCAAQRLVLAHANELGITVLPFAPMVYAPGRRSYVSTDELHPGEVVSDISGTQLRKHLRDGSAIPEWFTYPDVEAILRQRFPRPEHRGYAIFFTGLSGAGKSTLAQALMAAILETTGRPVSLLDGDEVRQTLSAGLGFSRADRSANIRRIAYVAAEIVRHRGIAICAPIAPYAEDRAEARALVEVHGDFIEVHVSTPLEVCEARDSKGLYAQARSGSLKHFTGISDPYEVPEAPDLRVDGSERLPALLVGQIVDVLRARQLIA